MRQLKRTRKVPEIAATTAHKFVSPAKPVEARNGECLCSKNCLVLAYRVTKMVGHHFRESVTIVWPEFAKGLSRSKRFDHLCDPNMKPPRSLCLFPTAMCCCRLQKHSACCIYPKRSCGDGGARPSVSDRQHGLFEVCRANEHETRPARDHEITQMTSSLSLYDAGAGSMSKSESAPV